MPKPMRVAVIDIGTITTRLFIADVEGATITQLVRDVEVTHPGEGLQETGRIGEAAFARVKASIERYVARIKEFDCQKVFCVATSASRDAENGEEFMAMLRECGVEPEIIPGAEEALYSFIGVAASFEGENILVSDTGGGSTELILGDSLRGEEDALSIDVHFARSVDVGARRVTDLYLKNDPPSTEELNCAREEIASLLKPAFEQMGEKPSKLIMVAGTATTVAAILEKLEEYDSSRVHGKEVSGSELSDLIEALAQMPIHARKNVAGLQPSRAGVIVGGMLVLETTLALAGLSSFTVSESDLLEGLILKKLAE